MTLEFPHVEFIDMGEKKLKKGIVKIANIQINTLYDEVNGNIRFQNHLATQQEEKIIGFINDAIKKDANLIVLPELSTSKKICHEIRSILKGQNRIIIMGSFYNEINQNISIIFNGKDSYSQEKINPSKYEKKFIWRGNKLRIFVNTPIGDFSVLICYDLTDTLIFTALRNYIDILICIARNQSYTTFDHILNAFTYLNYNCVVYCNDAKYGNSSVYLPLQKERKIATVQKGIEKLLLQTVDINLLDEMRNPNNPRKDNFKYPPALIKQRHWPNVPIEQRSIEYYKEESFNYLSPLFSKKILNDFLRMSNKSNTSSTCGGGSQSPYVNMLINSIRSLYVPGQVPRKMDLKNVVLKYYLLDLFELMSEDEPLLKNREKDKILSELKKYQDKCYMLFEIDFNEIKKEEEDLKKLINDIIKLSEIEFEHKIRELPKGDKLFQLESSSIDR